jgi:hypothetical protein
VALFRIHGKCGSVLYMLPCPRLAELYAGNVPSAEVLAWFV